MTAVAATGTVIWHQLLRTRRTWWSVVVSGIVQPTMFLLAIGAGIGSQIDDTELARLGAESYFAWIGPGILAVSAMQVASTEALWPTMGMLRWQGTYRAVLRSPIGVGTLGVAHALWLAVRAVVTATCFLVVLAIAGVATSFWALTIPLLGGLIGLAHGAPIAALTAGLENESPFSVISRVVIFPLFIFSGAFFPVDEMPAAFAFGARLTPTWHGVQAARHLASGEVTAHTIGHLALLAGLALIGVALVHRSFSRNVDP